MEIAIFHQASTSTPFSVILFSAHCLLTKLYISLFQNSLPLPRSSLSINAMEIYVSLAAIRQFSTSTPFSLSSIIGYPFVSFPEFSLVSPNGLTHNLNGNLCLPCAHSSKVYQYCFLFFEDLLLNSRSFPLNINTL